jgi:cytochrome bd-type quinol oxidase subunit 1
MNDLFFARSQMGMSLAFHIIFAVIGMAMPLLMAVSEGCYLWTKNGAPESTLKLLLLALGAGAVVLLPSLLYLFQIFKGQERR